MRKIGISFTLSFIIIIAVNYSGVQNVIWPLTNTYPISIYQNTSPDNESFDKIAIVNISNLPLNDIKTQIEIISQYQPAAIGIDYFLSELDSSTERIHFKNLVLPILINEENQTIQYSTNPFSTQSHFGFIESQQFYFEPFVRIDTTTYPSLPTQLIQLYDSNLYTEIKKGALKVK